MSFITFKYAQAMEASREILAQKIQPNLQPRTRRAGKRVVEVVPAMHGTFVEYVEEDCPETKLVGITNPLTSGRKWM